MVQRSAVFSFHESFVETEDGGSWVEDEIIRHDQGDYERIGEYCV